MREGPHALLRSGTTWLYHLHSLQSNFKDGGAAGLLEREALNSNINMDTEVNADKLQGMNTKPIMNN